MSTTSHAEAHAHDADHGHEHEHFIVPKFTLRTIFVLLITLTLLTVGAAQAETAFSWMFGVTIPPIVNVAIALSIAAVKTTLVVMFFMQLRYDSALNTMIFVFTIFTVAFFLGFTMIDTGNRGAIDSFKARPIHSGGDPSMAANINANLVGLDDKLARLEAIDPAAAKEANDELAAMQNASLVERVKVVARYLDAHGGGHGAHGGHSDGHATDASSANAARPVTGLTLPGFVHDEHGGGHGEHGEDTHDSHSTPNDGHEPAGEH